MAYLKALGILRLVSEQKDPEARGWWRHDVFWLRSRLDCDALVEFFLKEYKPTPLLAPWNAGSGFYLKWDEKKAGFKEREASDAVSAIERSVAVRFQPYREQIVAVKSALKQRADLVDPAAQIADVRERAKRGGWSKKRADTEVKDLLDGQMLFSAGGSTFAIRKVEKDQLVLDTRSSLLNDAALRWIDAAFVIRTAQKKNRKEAPLLGSGGNIGNSDFSARFMAILASLVPLNDTMEASDESMSLLRSALSGGAVAGLWTLAVDQFDPGRAGGANMDQGMEGDFRLNPWDYVLMLEGAVLFQSASSKRLGTGVSGSAFPFTVETAAAGFTSCGVDTTRGEQWLPLWHRACTAGEIEIVLAEGRSDVGRRQARTAVDFARAAASLGVDRGIQQFVRVQYQARLGDNYLANALGRVDTVLRESVDLLHEADDWVDGFRDACSSKDAPARLRNALRAIDTAVFEFCKYGGSSFFQKILVALGRAEAEVARAERIRERLRPIPGVSHDWIEAANDGSPEFALALGLASMYDAEQKIGPLRANLELVDWKKRCRAWTDTGRAVVWSGADLPTNLASVLERRMMDGQRNGCERLPMEARFSVPMHTVAAFIQGELDDERIEELIWGLMLVDSQRQDARAGIDSASPTDARPLAREYALLKLLFLPRPLIAERGGDQVRWRLARRGEAGVTIRPELRILPLLRTGLVGGPAGSPPNASALRAWCQCRGRCREGRCAIVSGTDARPTHASPGGWLPRC